MYLISGETIEHSLFIARELGLKKEDWLHVPWSPLEHRRNILRGRRIAKENLIGHFSEEEINRLTL